MNYYDGNTVTAMWNYAQHFALNDNSFGTTFGPSAPGAINLVSGNTGGVDTAHAVRGALTDGDTVADGTGGYSLIGDAQPYWDDCSNRDAVALTGTNVGDLLNAKHLSWGWFQGGFTPNTPYTGSPDTASTYNQLNEPGRATCTTTHNVGVALGGTGPVGHQGRLHRPPRAVPVLRVNGQPSPSGPDVAVGGRYRHRHAGQVQHRQPPVRPEHLRQPGLGHPRTASCHRATCPAVSFLKAPGYQDGHAAYSDPIDEQQFVVSEINSIESLPTWSSTAIILAYDDSDGWYDHVYSGVTNPSQTSADVLTGTNQCGTGDDLPLQRAGPLRLRPPTAAAHGHLALRQEQLRQQHPDRPVVGRQASSTQNWSLGEIPGSAANIAGSLDGMFNFARHGKTPALILSPKTGHLVPHRRYDQSRSRPVSGGPRSRSRDQLLDRPGATVVRFGSRRLSVTCSSTTTCVAVTPRSSMPLRPGDRGQWRQSRDNAAAFTYHT